MVTDNKAVIVTGAASGIGLAMTMGLTTAGYNVTAVDRNAAALADLGKQATGLKGSLQTVTADLSHPDSFAHVTGAALIKYGRIDALVIRINPHAFRHIVATGVAIAMPEEVRLTPFVLDHRTERTVQEHYNLADSLSASSRYPEPLGARRRLALDGNSKGG